MRIALFSDLHLECKAWEPPDLDVDVVILAGDIGSQSNGMAWASEAFRRSPVSPQVIYVAGNHEYYDASLRLLAEFQKPAWAQSGVAFLEQRTVVVGGVRILGCTLWSGFDLNGRGAPQAQAMVVARQSISDYWMIRGHDGKRLEPRETLSLFGDSVAWLDAELSKPFDGKTVVVTHFAPHRGCVAPQYQGDAVSPYFVTDLSRLMEKHQIAVWCYGHTHTNTDFIAENGCRVVSNQRGYPSETAIGFRPDLVIDLE